MMWGAASTAATIPVIDWLVAATTPIDVPLKFYKGGISPSEAVRRGGISLRKVMRGCGIQEREDLSIWFRNNGFAATAPRNHIASRAQEFLLSEAVAIDARVALFEAVYVCITLHTSRQLAVPHHVTEVSRRVVHRGTSPSTFPEGSWEQLDQVDLTDFFLLRLAMLKSCPHFLRARLRESFGTALAERHRAKSVGDEVGESRAWKLFGLVPAMLLHQPRCAGIIGRDELARRADQFAAGRWIELLNQARQTGTRMSRATPDFDEVEDQRRRGNAAQSRIQHGQVSRARHELTGASVGSEDSCRSSAHTPTRTATADQSRRSRVQARTIEFGQAIVRYSIAEFAIRESPRARRLHQRNAPRVLG